jgi:hypothetical protein
MNMCLILNGYRDTAVGIYRPKCVTFVFVGLEEEQSLQNKGGFIHSFSILSDDRSNASSKTVPPHSAI